MRKVLLAGFFALGLGVTGGAAQARMVCTVLADAATGQLLVETGDCRTQVTPASTFKIALATIGFAEGLLESADAPTRDFRPGYPDWGGAEWTRPADPARWMRHSIVWYSQLLAAELGEAKLTDWARRLGYGNADFSGDPGQNNGLERGWISSSLKISPIEQVAFLSGLVNGTLPIPAGARDRTMAIIEESTPGGGWRVWGKTGSAYPRRADGSFDRARGWGWFVGWAERDGRRLVFARLDQDEERPSRSGGLRAREHLLADWPALMAAGGAD
ncbi:class D beta-lactamase [Arsenicitalea aurantiaca]|uniref:beta-lactamase n=1 Tax=Arsenicitalea aurantiaca TaxID=1783274 RepID=A0A433XAD6_9HYPH|nr:class D beta-lactamase [Arsenicitalea aurantiaca]RUT31014.1 class D beta-lactamase [Arsenicitalea aurantiaca]